MKIHTFYMRKRHACESVVDYSEDHDAYFCRDCNVWTETGCSDVRCNFCRDRPARPLAYITLVKP
jgi:hypothetical protein